MDLDKLRLLRTAFEVRYAPNYRLWDRAGQVAMELLATMSPLELASAVPNKQQYVKLSDDKKSKIWTLEVDVEKSAIVFHKPARTLAILPSVLTQITNLLNRILEIEIYTRV